MVKYFTMNRKIKKSSGVISANSDNRKFCVAIQRQKFCYDTYEKAKKACEYSPNPQRVYYCKFCCAYHTTHFLKKSATGTEILQTREKSLMRAQSSDSKVLLMKRVSKPTLAIKRLLSKNYRPVVKKFLLEYLDSSRNEVALSEAQLRDGFNDIAKSLDDTIFTETAKWPFCDMKSAMVFYALYYIQINTFYRGESASDLIRLLFKESNDTSGACEVFDSLYESGLIIMTDEDSTGKRFRFDYFILKSEDKWTTPDDDPLAIETDDDSMINDALNSNYHPVVKEFLVEHLKKHRFDGDMIKGEELRIYINSSVLANPEDPNAQKAMDETLKWRFKSEKKAWQFLSLCYLEIIGGIYMSKPGDLVDILFSQGEHSASFISNVKNALFKEYKEGKLIITSCKGGSMYYQFSNSNPA